MSQTRRHSAGQILGQRYMLLSPIAQGGMGEVWKARDRETAQIVAAKVLRPELTGETASLGRFRTEAHNAMAVQHPNIAAVLDSGQDSGRGWIVMELVEGLPLTDFLKDGQRLAISDVLPILYQVAMALEALANGGVVHRDIKPANILIRPDGVAKLTDFGISRSVGQETMTAAGMVMGTAQYLPPEQAMGHRATTLGDLYALGIIAYECVAGQRPFTGTTQVDIAFSHVNNPVPPLPEDVPAPVTQIIMRLLEKEPKKRFQSGLILAKELAHVARELDLSVEPHPLAFVATMMENNADAHPDGPGTPAEEQRPANSHAAHSATKARRNSTVNTTAGTTSIPSLPPSPEPAPTGQPDAENKRAGKRSSASQTRVTQTRASQKRVGQRGQKRPPAPPIPTSRRSLKTKGGGGLVNKRQDAEAGPTWVKRQSLLGGARRPASGGSAGRNAIAVPAWLPLSTRPGVEHSNRSRTITKYNRSQVAPPMTRKERFGRAAVIILVIVTLLLIALAIVNRFMGNLIPSFATVLVTVDHPEEALLWLNPWAVA